MKDLKNIIIIQIINMIYFLLIEVFSKSNAAFLMTKNAIIVLYLIGSLYSLFAIIVSIKIKNNFKWLFLVISILFFLIYSYEIYFNIAIYNSN